MVSITHYSLKAAFLKMVSTVGMVGRMHIPRSGEGVRSLIARVQLSGQLVVTPSQWPPLTFQQGRMPEKIA